MIADQLVEVIVRNGTITLDSQGERVFSAQNAFALASRLVDAGVQADGACPLRPLLDRVVVRVIEEADRVSGGGVHIPDTARPDANRGVVLAIGSVLGINVGDIVTFSRHAGYEITIGSQPYRTMKASDVLAVVEQPPKENE